MYKLILCYLIIFLPYSLQAQSFKSPQPFGARGFDTIEFHFDGELRNHTGKVLFIREVMVDEEDDVMGVGNLQDLIFWDQDGRKVRSARLDFDEQDTPYRKLAMENYARLPKGSSGYTFKATTSYLLGALTTVAGAIVNTQIENKTTKGIVSGVTGVFGIHFILKGNKNLKIASHCTEIISY